MRVLGAMQRPLEDPAEEQDLNPDEGSELHYDTV